MRPYVDAHCHIGATINRAPPVEQSVGKCLARMASGGVAAAIASPTAIDGWWDVSVMTHRLTQIDLRHRYGRQSGVRRVSEHPSGMSLV